MPTTTRIPTIDDLRVKLCYICREEEQYDAPSETPPRPWVHPCNCTLIAHEQCLLKWIQTAQAHEGQAANAMKCSQCGARYELESDNPLVLRLLDFGNKTLQKTGTMFMVFGTATVAGLIGTSIYIMCTGYGAWAVKKFIGKEMFDLLLGDDPSYWPWSAFLNLPAIPFSLILSQFQGTSYVPVFFPIIMATPGSLSMNRKVAEYWRLPENARRMLHLPISPSQSATFPAAGRSWPPSPILFGLFGIPMLQMLYRRLYSQVYLKVMGTLPPETIMLRRAVNRNANHNANARRNNGVRMNIGEDFAMHMRANLREEVGQGANINPPAPNQAPNGQDGEGGEEEGDRVIAINASSVGRRVAGALLTPAIASWMGNLLLRLSRRSVLFRNFLGMRQPTGGVWVPPPLDTGIRDWHSLTALKQMTTGIQMIAKGFLGSSRTLSESDPVWWRNSIGFGLFIIAKDCLQLFYMWLSKRELASRKVKNRDFSGVEIRELDLIPTFLTLSGRRG